MLSPGGGGWRIGEQYFHKARYQEGAQGMIRKYMPLTEEFIRQYPKHYYVVGALYARGWGCEQLGDKAAALAEYQRAVDEYPQYPHSDLCLLRVAAIHQELREWDDAIAAAHKYLEIYPHRHPWEARFSAGISYYRKGDPRPAIAEFTEAFDSSPAAYEDRAPALFFRAMSHKALEEPVQARQDLEQLVASYPKHRLGAQAQEELAALGSQ
jgi:tetratricopeptide (TPR) repeat protein